MEPSGSGLNVPGASGERFLITAGAGVVAEKAKAPVFAATKAAAPRCLQKVRRSIDQEGSDFTAFSARGYPRNYRKRGDEL